MIMVPSALPTISPDFKFDIMQGWIDTCLQSHHRCRPPIQPCVPRRLIHLIDDGERSIRLHSPDGLVQFAALSYRWGWRLSRG
jgi:hypothetical protein